MTDPIELSNPFPGLRPFGPEENHLFFGRERIVDQLLTRLRRTRFLGVIGSSGCGKSSLVRAGLIPSLHGGVPGSQVDVSVLQVSTPLQYFSSLHSLSFSHTLLVYNSPIIFNSAIAAHGPPVTLFLL